MDLFINKKIFKIYTIKILIEKLPNLEIFLYHNNFKAIIIS